MVYIHIGYPKTATTFLQKNCFSKMEGFKYYNREQIIESGMIDIIYRRDCSINYDQIRTYFDIESDIIISFEGLVGNYLNGAISMELICGRIKEIFDNAKILITVRNQVDLLSSLYIQYIFAGGNLKIQQLLSQKPPSMVFFDWNYMSYQHILKCYEEMFGADNVMLLPNELIKNDSNEFLKQLHIFFDGKLKLKDLNSNIVVNKSLGVFYLFLLRKMNPFLKSYINPQGIFPFRRLTSYRLRLYLYKISSFVPLKKFNRKFKIDDVLKQKITDYYNNPNSQIKLKCSTINWDQLGY